MKGATADVGESPLVAMVARSADGNKELGSKLMRLGIRPVSVETVKFLGPSDWSPIDAALRRLKTFDWVVLTSARGANAFAERLERLHVRPTGGHPRIAAVGEVTAERLEKLGLRVDFVPSEYLTASVGRELPRRHGERVLLLRAEGANDEMVGLLEERRFRVMSLPIYRTRSITAPLRGSRAVLDARVVVLGSPSEVEGLVRRLPAPALRTLQEKAVAACIGPVTASAARRAGFSHVVSPRLHTFDAIHMEDKRSVLP